MGVAPSIGGRGVPDLSPASLAPTNNETVAAATSTVVVRSYLITTSSTLLLGAGSRLRIL